MFQHVEGLQQHGGLCPGILRTDVIAGKRGAEQLLKLSPRFHPLPVPYGKDISDFYLNGGDIYAWIEKGLVAQCLENTLLPQPI